MNEEQWTSFLRSYSLENSGRRTRLGVFELNGDVVNDYWLEDGLPLVDIVLEQIDGTKNVRINLGTMSYEVKDAVKISAYLTNTGTEDGLDLLDRENRVTILRFET